MISLPRTYYKKHKRDVELGRGRKFLLLADIHVPYHDPKALNEALAGGQAFGADTVIILGDMMDFHRISRYPNEPGTLSFVDELRVGAQVLFCIREAFPDAEILYVEGNHEVRLFDYVSKNCDEFLDLKSLSMPALLDMNMQEVSYIRGGFIHCGDMSFIHGHELRGLGGVNPSRKLYTKMKKSAICGHLHRPESFYTRDGQGKLIQCHILGHLGEPSPAYHPRNDWQHGYGLVEVTKKGRVWVQNVIIDE